MYQNFSKSFHDFANILSISPSKFLKKFSRKKASSVRKQKKTDNTSPFINACSLPFRVILSTLHVEIKPLLMLFNSQKNYVIESNSITSHICFIFLFHRFFVTPRFVFCFNCKWYWKLHPIPPMFFIILSTDKKHVVLRGNTSVNFSEYRFFLLKM